MIDFSQEKRSNEPKTSAIFGEVISHYSQDEAIEDGVLAWVGMAGKERVIFTNTLFRGIYEDIEKRKALIETGLKLLSIPDREDSEFMRLRVIDKNRIWVIWNQNEGITFLRPEDY